MANPNAPFGMRPVRYLNGSPWNGQARAYFVPSTNSNAMFIGDPIVADKLGNATEFMGFPPGSLTRAKLAAAGDTELVRGVIVGVMPETRDSTIYRPASVNSVIWVADDPNLVFHVRDDGAGTPAETWAGANAVLASGTGSTVTGQSGWVLDGSDTPAADASNTLLILGLANMPNNELGDYAIWEVIINQHELITRNTLGQALS